MWIADIFLGQRSCSLMWATAYKPWSPAYMHGFMFYTYVLLLALLLCVRETGLCIFSVGFLYGVCPDPVAESTG